MIKKGADYNSVSGFGQSEFKPLPKGGYVCRVIMAEEKMSNTNKPMVHIAFDIVEGDYTGYFMNLFQQRKKKDAMENPTKETKYPFEGQAWIMVNDYDDPNKTSRKFKGFCSAIEDSGTEIWNLDGTLALDRIKGAEVGVIFQDVENEYNGKTTWRAQPWGFRSIEAIATGDYFVPDDKPLPDTHGTGFAETNDTFDSQLAELPF